MSERRSRQRSALEAAQTFYCSWGHHRTIQRPTVNEHFEHGTMCWECQLAITENLRLYITMPEMSAAARGEEQRRNVKARETKQKLSSVRGEATGFVYYIRINDQIKIGYTANLNQRTRHYPPGSELLAIEPGSLLTERERHQDFHRDLVLGREWFTESPKLAAHIASLVEVYGDVSDLAHQYTKPKAG